MMRKNFHLYHHHLQRRATTTIIIRKRRIPTIDKIRKEEEEVRGERRTNGLRKMNNHVIQAKKESRKEQGKN